MKNRVVNARHRVYKRTDTRYRGRWRQSLPSPEADMASARRTTYADGGACGYTTGQSVVTFTMVEPDSETGEWGRCIVYGGIA